MPIDHGSSESFKAREERESLQPVALLLVLEEHPLPPPSFNSPPSPFVFLARPSIRGTRGGAFSLLPSISCLICRRERERERMRTEVGVSPGNVPVYYGGGKLRAVEKKVKVAEVVLRCLICGLGVLAAALIGSDTQVRQFFSLEKKAKFTDIKALVFLVIANGIAAGYSLIQGVRCVVGIVRGSVLFDRSMAWAIFSCDQVMAYLTVAALGAALQSAMISQFGQPQMQWMKVCNLYGKFCTQSGEGLVSAFLVSLCMVTISGMSAFNLFRLYGKDKGAGKNSTTVKC